MELLSSVVSLLRDRGWQPVNVDAVVVCEERGWLRTGRPCASEWRLLWGLRSSR